MRFRKAASARRDPGVAARLPATKGMLACAAISLPLMLIFESTPTRVIGVLTLFGFIVFGVFAIAHPDFLTAVDDDEHDLPTRGVSAVET